MCHTILMLSNYYYINQPAKPATMSKKDVCNVKDLYKCEQFAISQSIEYRTIKSHLNTSASLICLALAMMLLMFYTCVCLHRPYKILDNQVSTNGQSFLRYGDFLQTYQKSINVCTTEEHSRFDCYPDTNHPTQEMCIQRGCCWNDSKVVDGAPACFFASDYDGYKLACIVPVLQRNHVVGFNATLKRKTLSPYPNDVKELRLFVLFESEYQVRVKIFDPHNKRYEVPVDLPALWNTSLDETLYDVMFDVNNFGISIFRKSTQEPLFDSIRMAPLIFADQYIQFGMKLTSPYIYGLGEHQSSFLQNINWKKQVFWTRDQYPEPGTNLYSSHPFFINLESDGKAHGVFLLNSNAMQIDLQPYGSGGALTYRTTGGILDFFVFLGPTPDDVVQQYVRLIGRPFMPPLWALGFHLCKHGYGNSSEFYKVIQRNRAAKMPYDAQWNDLDYSKDNLDWTFDNQTYQGLQDIIDNLHSHGQHYIIIVDPGISSSKQPGTYLPFDLGSKYGIFLMNENGTAPLIGQVWPGKTAFVDFFHPSAFDYWMQLVSQFHNILAFDGLWIDMNEPSNFVNGSINGCIDNNLNNPPFVPPGIDGGSLYSYTTCPSALQNLSTHYNLHNLYGWSETRLTAEVLWKLFGKRTLVLSRSTAPGSGRYGAHWTGDNLSSFQDMYYSIPGILNFNLFGIPLVGADICGFRGNSFRELCIRWMQLGAFYPFMRNHAEGYSVPQDPGFYDQEAQDIMRAALEMRYSLLPYFYTQFYKSHILGIPVIRPLLFDYPGTEAIDTQFLWGHELLISPVLAEGTTSVYAYIPKGTWYDFQSLTQINVTEGHWSWLAAPLNKINVHLRGGSILPMMQPAVTTTLVRQGKIELLVAPDHSMNLTAASGQLFWDDGESLDSLELGLYTELKFVLYNTYLESEVLSKGYGPAVLGKITLLGLRYLPQDLTFNGQVVSFSYNPSSQVLIVNSLSWDLLVPFILQWS